MGLSQLLDDSASPIRRLVSAQEARDEPLGCCMLTACMILALAGQVPEDPTDWRHFYRLDAIAWQRMNRWKGWVQIEGPYDCLRAAQELVGGEVIMDADELPLEAGAYLVQHDGLSPPYRGHSYFVVHDPSCPWGGMPLRWVDSTAHEYDRAGNLIRKGRGMRDWAQPLSHWPRPGRKVAVLRLPESVT